MSDHDTDEQRRTLLKTAAAGLAVGLASANAKTDASEAKALASVGKPGDFNFLAGEWKIKHRKRKADGTWDEFEGEATCWTILNGVGSVEELRIPARDFSGMGLRLLDIEKKQWSDFWVNAKSGALVSPGVTGAFINGDGVFISDDVDGENKPIKVRGLWDGISKNSCRWSQSVSYDGGKTWRDDWLMQWTRVK